MHWPFKTKENTLDNRFGFCCQALELGEAVKSRHTVAPSSGGRLETFLCFKFKCTKTYSCRGFESLFNTCVNMLYDQIWLGYTMKIYALLKWDPMFSPHRISLIHHHWKGLRPMMPATSWPLTWSGKVDRAIIFSTRKHILNHVQRNNRRYMYIYILQ